MSRIQRNFTERKINELRVSMTYYIRSPHPRRAILFQPTQEQGGYLTVKQAAGLGYVAIKRNYHVGAGNWVRERRDIFSLSLYPPPDRPDLILWWLWSRGRSDSPVGVFSHQTAMSLHELTDL